MSKSGDSVYTLGIPGWNSYFSVEYPSFLWQCCNKWLSPCRFRRWLLDIRNGVGIKSLVEGIWNFQHSQTCLRNILNTSLCDACAPVFSSQELGVVEFFAGCKSICGGFRSVGPMDGAVCSPLLSSFYGHGMFQNHQSSNKH